ncbi:hypothetical protein OW763_10300 [Clostridium aestuarii]|uniref:Carboxypeptidase regulatory-like domain-containing protein n=1 Tax=Clostridium aestuarii TaxID=338193 RepID=A0ABT4D263_9CLOT|nr:hypothetical protein [Clostridium aestuarii]MCY6484732.1 hypothetical protein [Clostridium aestuarii]
MDKYELGQSQMGSVTEQQQEIRLDLELEKNIYYDSSIIYGYINDLCENPIQNARVSFIDEDNKEIGAVYSSKQGFYIYMGVKQNSKIKIVVEKIGYKKMVSESLNIYSEAYEYNVYLEQAIIPDKTLISGHIVDEKDIPLANISMYLLKKTCYGGEIIYKVTISNIYGQFVFSRIPKGNYCIIVNNPKFKAYQEYIEIIETDKIFDINIKLIKRNTKTKISGQVKDKIGNPIPNALAILYRIEEDGRFVSVKYTMCDQEGKYSFADIPYANYVVKAK